MQVALNYVDLTKLIVIMLVGFSVFTPLLFLFFDVEKILFHCLFSDDIISSANIESTKVLGSSDDPTFRSTAFGLLSLSALRVIRFGRNHVRLGPISRSRTDLLQAGFDLEQRLQRRFESSKA
jgi:hypothetical protein